MNGIIGLNGRNIDLVLGKNERKYFPLVDDKLLTKEILEREGFGSVPVICQCSSFFEVDLFLASLNRHGGPFVLKPSHGYGGEGIIIVKNVLPGGNWDCGSLGIWPPLQQADYIGEILYGVFSLSGDSDVAFAEELIVAHHGIGAFAKDGLPDIRVIIHKGTPIAAMMRVPTSESHGKANLHAGGCATAIDIESGVTSFGWYRGKRADTHPEKEIPFAGVGIPFWDEILRISKALYTHFPLGYMGADFTIDDKYGPVILELNARPGLEIQNVLGKGLGHVLQEVSRA